ncbi:MAG TPA: hypothetical protein VFS09_12320 [Candidatus Eisenbacteria bacterium]|nr:hypothetical protein [Candidatus Eisenbacteria bacterium]
MRDASSGFVSVSRPWKQRAGASRISVVVLVALAWWASVAPLASAAIGGAVDERALADALGRIELPAGTRLVESPADLGAPEAEARLRASGYEIAVSIPPTLRIVRATRRAGPLPAGFVSRTVGVVTTSSAPAMTSAAAPAADVDPFHGLADALPPAPPPSGLLAAGGRAPLASGSAPPLPSGLFYGTRWDDLSEYMVGKVGIGIYFPESDGSLDQNRYDWTPALRDSVVRSAVRGFLGWSDFAAARGIPLSFYLEIHPSLPTRYEPITRTVNQEELWIEDMLRPLVGTKGDAVTMSYEVANGVRARLGTHWAGLVFAVQNDSSSTGYFPDGLIAHARLGGPWFVIPVNNLRSTSASLDFYMRHEITHLFWALDEFPANNAWWSCALSTGYFNRPNWNSDVPIPGYCEPHVDCLMRGNWPNALCARTAEQVGWVDADQSGLLDLYETRPLVFPDSTRYRLSAGNPLFLHGKAGESALPNVNPYRSYSGDSISVSVIDSIFYRVDGGAWTSLPAADGRFDEGEERFDLTLPPLPIGNHAIEWQARNSNGLLAAINATTSVTVSGSAGAVDAPDSGESRSLGLAVFPSPGRGAIRFSVTGARGGRALVRIWTATGRLAKSWSVEAAAAGGAWTWDGRLAGGERAASGVYFVTVESGGERVRRRLVYLR